MDQQRIVRNCLEASIPYTGNTDEYPAFQKWLDALAKTIVTELNSTKKETS